MDNSIYIKKRKGCEKGYSCYRCEDRIEISVRVRLGPCRLRIGCEPCFVENVLFPLLDEPKGIDDLALSMLKNMHKMEQYEIDEAFEDCMIGRDAGDPKTCTLDRLHLCITHDSDFYKSDSIQLRVHERMVNDYIEWSRTPITDRSTHSKRSCEECGGRMNVWTFVSSKTDIDMCIECLFTRKRILLLYTGYSDYDTVPEEQKETDRPERSYYIDYGTLRIYKYRRDMAFKRGRKEDFERYDKKFSLYEKVRSLMIF